MNTCVTSPPYWGLRDYGVEGQLGLEETPEAYVSKLVEVFRGVRRVLRDDGTVFLNLGDSYAAGGHGGHNKSESFNGHNDREGDRCPKKAPPGLKPKDMVGIPWMVAFALRADGWYLRQEIIWHKPAPMPESVTDRCTKAHESIFLLAKSQRYYFDSEAIAEPGVEPDRQRSDRIGGKNGATVRHSHGGVMGASQTRNKRSVWTVNTKPYKGAHFATFPPKLIEPCILAGCPEGGTVLDPFLGSGTTAAVAQKFGRKCIGIELNEEYCELAAKRFRQRTLLPITGK